MRDGDRAFRAESARTPSASESALCHGLGTPAARIYRLYNGKDAVACQKGPASIYAVVPVPSAAPVPVMAVVAASSPVAAVAVPVIAPVAMAPAVPAVTARHVVSLAPGEIFPIPPG